MDVSGRRPQQSHKKILRNHERRSRVKERGGIWHF